MHTLVMMPVAFGAVTTVIGAIWFLVIAFRRHILWGLGCLLVPFVALVFLYKYFKTVAKPFGLACLGCVLVAVARLIRPA